MSTTQFPPNWFVSGKNPENLAVDVVDKTMHVTATAASVSDFGSVVQTISARRYAGKRLRFAAEVKSADIIGSAGLWMRVDGQNREVLAFDNMQSRPITGTTDWRQYSIVLPAGRRGCATCRSAASPPAFRVRRLANRGRRRIWT
jgi:hypothetical protein